MNLLPNLRDLSKALLGLATNQAETNKTIEQLQNEVKQLRSTNEQLVGIILGASDYDAMKTNVRLAKNNLCSNKDTPPRKP
jgi:hypothetical protein